MIDLTKLRCILANTAATVALKLRLGVDCGVSLNTLYTAYSYVKIAEGIADGCDLSVNKLDDIVSFQDEQSLSIQTCC